MIEGINNKLNVESVSTLRWPVLLDMNSPYQDSVSFDDIAAVHPYFLSAIPISVIENTIATFQVVAKWNDTQYSFPIKVTFSTSLDGVNWDKIPGEQFLPNLDELVLGDENYSGGYSASFQVLTTAKYIRFGVKFDGEGYPVGTLKVYVTQKEA